MIAKRAKSIKIGIDGHGDKKKPPRKKPTNPKMEIKYGLWIF